MSMDHLPLFDTHMLVSAINCLLRDREFDNLDDICSYYELERADIDARLAAGGYAYSAELNTIKQSL